MSLHLQYINYLLANKKSIISFCVVGLLTAIIYFIAFTVFWKILGMGYILSLTLSNIFSILFHFTTNNRITFQNKNTRFSTKVAKYSVLLTINYVITVLIVSAMVEKFNVSPYLGIIIAIGVNVNLGYLMSRYWVFRNIE